VSSAAFAVPDRALVLDRYRPLRPLGRGGSGSVWLARDERTGLDVALKIVPREGKRAARAAREMEAASRLRHERCVRAYDFGGDPGHVYIAYEYVRGRTLRETLRTEELDDAAAVEIAAQVLDGLAHAHRHGIVHRDVKPSNVLVEETDPISIRVLDFGLAQFDEADTLTAVGDVPGTLAYISPERLGGEDASERSDVWAVGVILWESLAGSHPFWGVPLPQVASTIASGAPPLSARRTDLPRRLLAAVDSALAVDPAKRPPAARLAAELREAFVVARPPAAERQRAAGEARDRGRGEDARARVQRTPPRAPGGLDGEREERQQAERGKQWPGAEGEPRPRVPPRDREPTEREHAVDDRGGLSDVSEREDGHRERHGEAEPRRAQRRKARREGKRGEQRAGPEWQE
jgi:serine/threonine-protein kinase